MDTAQPVLIARMRTERGGTKRSMPIPMLAVGSDGYRHIDKKETLKRLNATGTPRNGTDEPLVRGEK